MSSGSPGGRKAQTPDQSPGSKKAGRIADSHRLVGEAIRRLVDAGVVGIAIADPSGAISEANDFYLRLVGYTREELDAGKIDWRALTPPEWLHADERAIRQLTERGVCAPYEKEYVRRDGTRVPVLLADARLLGSKDKIAAFVLDRTDQKKAEVAWRSNEGQYRSLFENMLNGFAFCRMIYDQDRPVDFIYLAVNAAFGRLTGLRDVVGRRVSEVIPGIREADPRLFEIYGRVARTGKPEVFETYVEALQNWFFISVYSSARDHFVAVFDVITDRKRAEERMREQAALLDGASDAIYVTAMDCSIVYWNPAATRIYGWTAAETIGRKTAELMAAEEGGVGEARTITVERGEWTGERRQKRKSGQPVDVLSRLTLLRDADGRPRSILVINTDITEQKELEARFLRAQRLESIGALASGMAHDLNNVLAPILMAAPLLRDVATDHTTRNLLSLMETSARRGADIVRQVLTFARGTEGQRIVLHAVHLVRDMVRIIAETFPKNIEVANRSPADIWSVEGDATQLHQALLNLCVNARDAMPDGGVLTLAAENVVLDDAAAARIPGARAGRFVRLRVADTGTGIPPEVQDRIFEPFFTTKGVGKGTGLGLSTVLGIMKSHQGFVRVESEPGRGSTFDLYFPAAAEARTARDSAAAFSTLPWPRADGEWVMVVDDEAAVREVARQALAEFGYRVAAYGTGTEAIEAFRIARSEIHLVVTDMMMPEMDGPALVRALRAVNPEVRIVGITGTLDPPELSRVEALALSALLAKPFSVGDLLGAVDRAAKGPATTASGGSGG